MRTLLASFIIGLFVTAPAKSAVISGHVYDTTSGEPVPQATIQVLGTGICVPANDDGSFRLRVRPGHYHIKATHVAHYSSTLEATVDDSLTLDFYLTPAIIELPEIHVMERDYDEGERIILQAIKRKEAILAAIKQYTFEAYSRIIMRDTTKPDSTSIWMIAETQVDGFYQYPDNYKEIIRARKQSANLPPEGNMLAIGEILNFNKNRIDLGQYSVVSPTADDALDYYNYYVLDTITVENRRVFILEIEPETQSAPLFQGTIRIMDSTYEVTGVDVGFNEGFDTQYLYDPRYVQVFSKYENDIWMPSVITFSGVINIGIPIIPVLRLNYVASFSRYAISEPIPENTFDEFELVVDPKADDLDATQWQTAQSIPLTQQETVAYRRIDSTSNAPKPIYKQALNATLGLGFLAFSSKTFFHFNRVEGPYLGIGYGTDRLHPVVHPRFAIGYAFDAELWQHLYGVELFISKRQRLSLDLEYRDQVRNRPTMISPTTGNPSFMALMAKYDPYDYYREKGVSLNVESKLLNKTTARLSLDIFDHTSLPVNNEYSIFRTNDPPRPNPSAFDGDYRSIGMSFLFDSRPVMDNKGRIARMGTIPFTFVQFAVEHSTDGFLDSDFDFTRYFAYLFRVQRLGNLGITRISAFAGQSDRTLPPQRMFVIDFGDGITERRTAFHTLNETNFGGTRAAMIFVNHSFEKSLFIASGIPLIKDLPFGLTVHAGHFWCDFNQSSLDPHDQALAEAPTVYSEVGFGISRLLPLGLELDFSWQLSDYDTNRFSVSLVGGYIF